MAQRTRTQYKSLYGTSGTLFPDNTTGEISEADVRAFGEDSADSVPFTAEDSYTWAFPSANAAGTNTYTATLSPAITSYVSGQKVQLVFANPNSGASTINLNGLGAKAITKNGGTALVSGDISAGQALFLYYDGTQFQIQGGGSGTVPDASLTVKGIVELATPLETTTGTDTVRAVTPAGVKAAIDALINAAPGTLDTLDELANALGDDPNFATTIINLLAAKLAITERVLGLAFSDELTALSLGTDKLTFHFPYTTTIQEIWVEVKTAQTSGSILTIDVHKNGTTILSTKLTIDNNEETSLTAVTPAVISVPAVTKGDKMTIDVDQIGNLTAIAGKIWFRG